jgi:hypothetical protein
MIGDLSVLYAHHIHTFKLDLAVGRSNSEERALVGPVIAASSIAIGIRFFCAKGLSAALHRGIHHDLLFALRHVADRVRA